jgi:hypothetical protein
MATRKGPEKVRAREAMVLTVGARAPTYHTALVRNRHTNRLEEVPLNPELPPIDPGDEGTAYVFRRDEEVYDDHPAVAHAPHLFVPVGETVNQATPRR